jgi:hypothetical protein
VDEIIPEEPVAFILKVKVKMVRVWPGYIGSLTWTVIIHNHRTERGDKPIQGNRNGELEL